MPARSHVRDFLRHSLLFPDHAFVARSIGPDGVPELASSDLRGQAPAVAPAKMIDQSVRPFVVEA